MSVPDPIGQQVAKWNDSLSYLCPRDSREVWPMAWALFVERMEEARNAPDVMFDGQEVLDVLNDCLAKALRTWAHPPIIAREAGKP